MATSTEDDGRFGGAPAGHKGPPPAGHKGPPSAGQKGSPPAGQKGPPPAEKKGPPSAEQKGPPPAEKKGPPHAGQKGPPPAEKKGSPPAEQKGMKELVGWVSAHAPDLEVIAQRRDLDGPMVDRALEIVRQFIIDRGLILFGGLAIDYALRLKGSRIYPDDERPDFDFLSPNSVNDAYDLADMLVKRGFEAVGAIRGIHVQTMKVRTNFIWVADIGFAPKEVFDRIPTLVWRGMRIIHPDYQRMDQHLAFCFPFNGPPREDVFHRWRKDLKRFNLYDDHYPISLSGGPATELSEIVGRLSVPVISGRGLGAEATPAVALHGFAAYAVLRRTLDELAAALGAEHGADAPALAISFPDEYSVSVAAPGAGTRVYFAAPDPAAAVAGLGDAQWCDPYMDISPESVRAGNVTVLSTRGRLLAVSAVRAGNGRALVVSPQYLLLHFLFESHRAPDESHREMYRNYYRHALDVIGAAEKMVADRCDAAAGDDLRAECLALFAQSPFAPTISTLGTVNHDAAYVIKMANNAEKLRDTPPPALNLDANIAELLRGLPQNYYPGGNKVRPTFDYSVSPLFRRAGAARP